MGNKKILVIDDNAGILFAMQRALEIKGYEVHTTERFSGVASIEKSAPDLIYLDISLLGKDGREVSRELKKNHGTKKIPVIILTAHPNADELAKEAEADSYLSKPFELEHLWKTTEKYAAASNA